MTWRRSGMPPNATAALSLPMREDLPPARMTAGGRAAVWLVDAIIECLRRCIVSFRRSWFRFLCHGRCSTLVFAGKGVKAGCDDNRNAGDHPEIRFFGKEQDADADRPHQAGIAERR